ncbi:MAG: 4Fe-4S binding protein [Lachnospiraceae bacterium]
MKTLAMCFSPTGGTSKIMNIFSKSFIPDIRIDLCDIHVNETNYNLETGDLCFVGVPSYGGRVPQVAVERIHKIKGNGAKAIPIVVYGNRAYDDTLLELTEVLTKSGFHTIAAVAAIAEHSIMHQFATGRPDLQDEKELLEFCETIKRFTEDSNHLGDVQIPGNTPYREYNGVPFKPKANKKCNNCGLCQQNCPVGAIPKEHPAYTDEEKCISCMRCVSICPTQARQLHKLVLWVAGKKMKKVCQERKKNELFGI